METEETVLKRKKRKRKEKGESKIEEKRFNWSGDWSIYLRADRSARMPMSRCREPRSRELGAYCYVDDAATSTDWRTPGVATLCRQQDRACARAYLVLVLERLRRGNIAKISVYNRPGDQPRRDTSASSGGYYRESLDTENSFFFLLPWTAPVNFHANYISR